jgi:hypothetical protein
MIELRCIKVSALPPKRALQPTAHKDAPRVKTNVRRMIHGVLPVGSEVHAMQARKSELEKEALGLPPQKRARLLRLLLESLDDEAEADVEAA